jgi:hypothetical protein
MRPDGALREDPLHGRLADRRHDPAGDRLLAHVLEGPRDREVLGLPAAVVPGVLLPDRLTGQAMISQRVTELNFGAWPRRGRSPRPLRRLRRNRPRQRSTRRTGTPKRFAI